MKKAAGNLEKTVLCVCSTFQSIWKATAKSQPDRSWCIKLIGCIWDKWFDLENIEKSVLNFRRFYTLS